MSVHSSKDFYDQEAVHYDTNRWSTPVGRHINAVQLDIFRGYIQSYTDKQTLEIAAGTGRFTQVVLDQDNSVTALDISDTMLTQLRARLCRHPHFGKLNILIGDARSIPVASESTDIVMCFNAMSHIPKHNSVFVEVSRILKKDGLFLFNVPNYLSVYFLFGAYINARKQSLTRKVYTRWYSHSEIKRDLELVGLTLSDMKGHFHVPTKTPAFFLPFVKFIDNNFRSGLLSRCAPILFMCAVKRR